MRDLKNFEIDQDAYQEYQAIKSGERDQLVKGTVHWASNFGSSEEYLQWIDQFEDLKYIGTDYEFVNFTLEGNTLAIRFRPVWDKKKLLIKEV